jgi:hypothetical protein
MCEIIREPNIAILYQSQEKQMAIDAVDMVRNWFMEPEIIRLYGKFESNDWSKSEFTVAQRDRTRKDPTMRASGLDIPMQSKRADIMVWDDMVGETNYNSDEGLIKVEQRIAASMPIIRPGGKGLYICTRWSPYDMSTEGFTVSNEPGIIRQWKRHNDPKKFPVWDCVEPRGWFGAYAQPGDEQTYPNAVVGEPLYPSILDEEQIARERVAYTNHAMFSSQILNDPIPDDSRYFDPENILLKSSTTRSRTTLATSTRRISSTSTTTSTASSTPLSSAPSPSSLSTLPEASLRRGEETTPRSPSATSSGLETTTTCT